MTAGEKTPLDGVRILGLAEQYPGPYATLLLADLGADVILVERCGRGDPSRQFPGFFEALNRNKRSIAVDLKRHRGREVFLRLVEDADVVMEGFRPGTVDRLGVGYDAVSRVNPAIVYVSISGFGQNGPYRDRTAHDLSYQATSGMLYDRARAAQPEPTPTLTVGDLSAGMFATVAVLTGLFERERTGRGGYTDVSISDGLVSWMTAQLVPALNGMGDPWIPYDPGYGLFRTADGALLSLSIAHEDHFWRSLCEVAGMDGAAHLAGPDRRRRHDELRDQLEAAIATESRVYWEKVLANAGVPFGPVHDLADVADDPHVSVRGLFTTVAPAAGRPARIHIRQPLQISGHDCVPRRHAPYHGEHTQEVLTAAGYESALLDALLRDGVVETKDG